MSLGLGSAATEKQALSRLCISHLTSICVSLHVLLSLHQHSYSREPKQRWQKTCCPTLHGSRTNV